MRITMLILMAHDVIPYEVHDADTSASRHARYQGSRHRIFCIKEAAESESKFIVPDVITNICSLLPECFGTTTTNHMSSTYDLAYARLSDTTNTTSFNLSVQGSITGVVYV